MKRWKVKVILRNRYAKFQKPYPEDELQEFFRYRKPGYYFVPSYRQGWWEDGVFIRKWDGYTNLLRYNKVGTGLFLARQKEIEEKTGIRFIVNDCRQKVPLKKDNLLSDRSYQNECVTAMQKSLSGGLVLAATRTGKTRTVGMYFRKLYGSAVFVVDELTLMDQAKKELEGTLKEKVGIVGKGIFAPERITVATIQTIHKHRGKPEFANWAYDLDVMVIDEIHVQINRRNINTVRSIAPPVVFGLTATLELKKPHVRLPVYDMTGEPIFEYPLEQGVEEKYLVPGVVMSVGIHQEGIDESYNNEYNEMIVRSKVRNRAIASLVREAYEQDRSTIVIVERVKHLKKLSKMLEDIPHRTVYGEKKVEDRIKAISKFDKDKIKLMIVNKVFKKGITIKSVDTIIEAAALKSKNDAIQKYGRGIGLCKGKEGLIYIDISDRHVEGSRNKNRFSKGTASRLNALKSRGIKVEKIEWSHNPEEIIERAKLLLKKEIQKLEKKGKAS